MKRTDAQLKTAERCAKCGACTAVCPVYRVSGRESLTARGRMHLLSRLSNPFSPAFGEIISACLLCGACLDVCPRKIDTLSPLITAREQLPHSARYHFLEKLIARKTLASPRLLGGLAGFRQKLLRHLPKSSGLRMKLAFLSDDISTETFPFNSRERKEKPSTVSYFSGCFARFANRDISASMDFLAGKITEGPLLMPEEQTCCGLASFAAGSKQEAQDIARQNIAAFAGNTLPILTSCASCYSHLRSYPSLLADDPHWCGQAEGFAGRLREFSRFFLEAGLCQPTSSPNKKQTATLRVFYHDPCHLRFGPQKTISQPRNLLTNVIGAPPLEPTTGPRCCGQGGLFNIAHAPLSRQIFSQALEQLSELSATHVVTTCSGCLLQWQQGMRQAGLTARTCHLAVLLAGIIRQCDM